MKRLISKREVCTKTSYSRAHIDRLSNDPDYQHHGFPRTVRLGQARVAYLESEIDEWIERKLAERDSSEK